MGVVRLSRVATAFLGAGGAERASQQPASVSTRSRDQLTVAVTVPLHQSSDAERSKGRERREPGSQNCVWL